VIDPTLGWGDDSARRNQTPSAFSACPTRATYSQSLARAGDHVYPDAPMDSPGTEAAAIPLAGLDPPTLRGPPGPMSGPANCCWVTVIAAVSLPVALLYDAPPRSPPSWWFPQCESSSAPPPLGADACFNHHTTVGSKSVRAAADGKVPAW